jgi:cell division protein ZapA (FtsZ GTPase activity inhibitor)
MCQFGPVTAINATHCLSELTNEVATGLDYCDPDDQRHT